MELECSVESQNKQGECSKGLFNRNEFEQNCSDGEGAERERSFGQMFKK